MNKKAGERVLSIYLFIIYIIVGIGIVSGVIIFYGSPLDVREMEAGILSNKVIDCLVDQGELNEGVLKGDFDLVGECHFDFRDNTKKYDGEERYGVLVEVYGFDDLKEKNKIIFGRDDFLEYCDSEGEKIPKCNKKELYVLDGKDKILLSVVSAVGKVQNV